MSVQELTSDRPLAQAVQTALRAWFTVRPGAAPAAPALITEQRTYYDTFDGLLHAAGLELFHADQRLTLRERDSGREWQAQLHEPPEVPPFATSLPDCELQRLVAEQIDVRALLKLATVSVRSETFNVLDRLEKTVVRVHVQTPKVITPTGSDAVSLTPRLRIATLRGYESAAEKVERLLARSDLFDTASAPLLDEAVTAIGGRPGGVDLSVEVKMERDERADIVAARVCTRLLQIMDATLAGTIADTDTEFLHDYRVAIRRTRSVLKEMPGVFPPEELSYLRQEFRWLQEVTGTVRDLDVWLLEIDQMSELVPAPLRAHMSALKNVIRRRRAAAYTQMCTALSSQRAVDLIRRSAALLAVLVLEDQSDRPDAATPVGDVAARRIRRVHHRMIKMGRAIDEQTEPQAYHDLRKRGKELRYLLELFGAPLYDPQVVKPAIRALKGLQDVLGRHQDREVQIHTLKELAGELADEPDGPLALMAVGAMVDRLEADAAQARGEFADRFKAFSSQQQIKLIHDTFPS